LKGDNIIPAIRIYFIAKVVCILSGVALFFLNIPHPSFLNFLFEDSSLYNLSLIIPILISVGYLYCFRGFKTGSNLSRIIAVLLCFVNVFVFPIGTIISGALIIYLVFCAKDTFSMVIKKNLPFRAVGSAILIVSALGLVSVTGVLGDFQDSIPVSHSLSTAEKIETPESGMVDVIVEIKGLGTSSLSTQNLVVQDITALGGSIEGRTIHVLNAVNTIIDADSLMQLASDPNIARIAPNEKIYHIVDFHDDIDYTMLLDNSHNIVNADPLWDKGVTGDGIVVAVVDTGINADIPALQRDGQSVVIDSFELFGDWTIYHGSACASCIASQDATHPGIAPDVDLLDVGVFDADGSGSPWDIIEGWEWVANWKITHNRFVICSNSFGAPSSGCGWGNPCIICNAANNMVERYNIPMVVAAGNYGGDPKTIDCPGQAEYVLTVGAVDDSLQIAYFSGRGPTTDGNNKPDVVAPGYPVNMFDDNGALISESGTSFSTPTVAGVLALVAQEHESYSVKQFNNAIRRSAVDLGDSGFDYEYGYGLADADAAYYMIENEIPEQSYTVLFSSLIFIGVGIVSFPEWRKRL